MHVSRLLVVGLLTLASVVVSKPALAHCNYAHPNFVDTVDGCRDIISGLEFSHDISLAVGGAMYLSRAKSECAARGFRLPTKTELANGAAHGLQYAVQLAGAPNGSNYFLWWTATAKGNKTYAIDIRSGIQYLIQTSSSAVFAICVR